MTILAVDDCPDALTELKKNLQMVFPQETVVAFKGALFAPQYVCRHPKEIGLTFSAMGAANYFVVQTENSELAAIAKQHGNGTCLPRPITVESIRQATSFLHEPCQWEVEECEEGCLCEWCEHRKRKISV